MKIQLSQKLLDFFLEVEVIPNTLEIIDSSYHFEELLYSTNEYTLKTCLKYRIEFDKNEMYGEISKILNDVGHPTNTEIINSFILLFCLSKKELRNPSLINNFFSLIKNCRLKQYLFLNVQAVEKICRLKFKDFSIGNIDYDKFSDFIKNHSNSDYAIKYKSSLTNATGIEIKYYEMTIVDVFEWQQYTFKSLNPEWFSIEVTNYYLTAISNFSFNIFKRKFYKQQEFINAYFGVFYSLEVFEMLSVTLVNIFYNFLDSANNGWVLPIKKGLSTVKFPDPRIVEKVNSFVLKNENEVYQNDGEFSRYLDFICSLFSNTEKNIENGNLNHAFVDFFVGLDFLLAPDTEKSKKLKQRISLLTHKMMSLSFSEQLNRLDILYDERSLYVHQGKSVAVEELVELRNIARVILSVLLEVHRSNTKTQKLTQNKWIEKIDDFVQQIYRGITLNEQQLSSIGIKKQKVFFQDDLYRYSF